MIRRFISGFGFVFSGWRHFQEVQGLKKWVALPLIIDLIIFILGIYVGLHYIHHLLWRILFFIFYLFFVYVFATVVGSPFYRLLAAKTLERLGFVRNQKNLSSRIVHSSKMMVATVMRAIVLLTCAVVLFVLSFIPGLNVLTTFFGFILVAFDITDYALELKGYHLVQRFRFLLRAWPEYLGMAAFITLTALIPGLIVLLMPFAIVGATIVVHKATLMAPNPQRKNRMP